MSQCHKTFFGNKLERFKLFDIPTLVYCLLSVTSLQVSACTKIDLYSSDVFTQYNHKNTTPSTTTAGACMLSVIMLIFEIKTVMLSVVIMLISVNYSQKSFLHWTEMGRSMPWCKNIDKFFRIE